MSFLSFSTFSSRWRFSCRIGDSNNALVIRTTWFEFKPPYLNDDQRSSFFYRTVLGNTSMIPFYHISLIHNSYLEWDYSLAPHSTLTVSILPGCPTVLLYPVLQCTELTLPYLGDMFGQSITTAE